MNPVMLKHPSDALEFHELAKGFLSSTGLFLTNNPAEWIGRYAYSSARYTSKRGFSLLVGFESVDGNYADVFFGREWQADGRFLFLSSTYASIANRFGYALPSVYQLGFEPDVKLACNSILSDLKLTLPVILSRVNLEDLIAVENDQHGAATKAKGIFGPEFCKHVDISKFSRDEVS